MEEPALALCPGSLSPRKEVVRRFYKELWDHADTSLIPELFHEGFTFRGSLGSVLVGAAQFAGYVEQVTTALEHYTSDILLLLEEGEQVCGKLRFHGLHRAPLFGIPSSGRHVWWHGTPIFTFEGEKIRDLWVLGDIHGLRARLRGEEAGRP